MKSELQYRRLLDDVLLDEDLSVLQQELLNRCCGTMQRRRIRRFSLAGIAGIAAVLLLTFMLSHRIKQPRINVDTTCLVHTTNLTAQQIIHTSHTEDLVQTRSMPAQLVSSIHTPDVLVIKQIQIARISDTDLLNEFKGIPRGIIHTPDGSAKFVFFRAEDRQRFFHRR